MQLNLDAHGISNTPFQPRCLEHQFRVGAYSLTSSWVSIAKEPALGQENWWHQLFAGVEQRTAHVRGLGQGYCVQESTKILWLPFWKKKKELV